MDDKVLRTFLTVVEEKNFTKAAEKLYISHTAVIKQINALEENLDVKLFERGKRTVRLTSAGQVFYTESLQLVKAFDQSVERVRAAHYASQKTLRVGTSALFPCHRFLDIWIEIKDRCAEYPLKIEQFEDDWVHFPRVIEDFDFIIGADHPSLYGDKMRFFPIGRYRFCIAMPRTHALARMKKLSFRDLDGQPLMLRSRGSSPINDRIRRDLRWRHPGINLVDINSHYSISIFQHAAERNCPLLSLDCWDRIHPDMKLIPLEEVYETPYGIVYSHTPSENMKAFLSIIDALFKSAEK